MLKSQHFFLYLCGLDCFQLKIILMPKRSFGVPNCMKSHMDFLQSEEAKSSAFRGSVDPEYDATGPAHTRAPVVHRPHVVLGLECY